MSVSPSQTTTTTKDALVPPPLSTLGAALEVGWGLDIPGASVEKGSRGTQNAIIEG